MIPSDEALLLHWRRTCWVIHMWTQADLNTVTLEPITNHGRTINDPAITGNRLSIIWDSEDNLAQIHERVNALLKGARYHGLGIC